MQHTLSHCAAGVLQVSPALLLSLSLYSHFSSASMPLIYTEPLRRYLLSEASPDFLKLHSSLSPAILTHVVNTCTAACIPTEWMPAHASIGKDRFRLLRKTDYCLLSSQSQIQESKTARNTRWRKKRVSSPGLMNYP